MIGNIAVWMTGIELSVHNPNMFPHTVTVCMTALLSFCCAFILRKKIVKSIRQRGKEGKEGKGVGSL
jgi:hypothetical protein